MQHCAIIGIGTVELNLSGGSTVVLHNVRHVPELSRPLISARQLDEDSIRAGFSSRGWTLHKGNLMLARGPKVHYLYPLYVTLKEGDLFLVDIRTCVVRRLRCLTPHHVTPRVVSRLTDIGSTWLHRDRRRHSPVMGVYMG